MFAQCQIIRTFHLLFKGKSHHLPVFIAQVQRAWSVTGSGRGEEGTKKGTISQYFTTLHCPVCDELTQLGVCVRCRAEPQCVAVHLNQDLRLWESQQDQLLKVGGLVALVGQGLFTLEYVRSYPVSWFWEQVYN